ncbi:hypothetical protein L579_2354 [Pantoea sp. AS-PWVM4]|nr:hypothetical protein L579_2354 [Pantoea sp. AS-PWVM4]
MLLHGVNDVLFAAARELHADIGVSNGNYYSATEKKGG